MFDLKNLNREGIFKPWYENLLGSQLEVEAWKKVSARAAAKLVKAGMAVGLGSGTTVAHLVRILAERKSKAIFIPSSFTIQKLAGELGLGLGSLEDRQKLDLMIDGADEVDPDFNMIKGKGGAQTREKIVASAARKVVIVVDRTKLVKRLGERVPVPVEVLPFAYKFTMRKLAGLGGEPRLRTAPTGAPFVTDNGNYIVDVKFASIPRPAELEAAINRVPGVVENGLFVDVADVVLVGYEGGCAALRSRRDFLDFMHDINKKFET
jgi:ribose 5-phosphate isomerase A